MIKSTERSGNFILGFKVDPEEKLTVLYKELTSLHTVFLNNPIYGVEYKWSSKSTELEHKSDFLEDLEVFTISWGIFNIYSHILLGCRRS